MRFPTTADSMLAEVNAILSEDVPEGSRGQRGKLLLEIKYAPVMCRGDIAHRGVVGLVQGRDILFR